ncbi:MAG: TonB-dependent receptor domain-containing protein [Acidobacteriota bacterium]
MSIFIRWLTAITFLMVCSLQLYAQSSRGTITGIVRDATGAVVPGVEVTITNQDSGVDSTAITSDSGVYRAPYLPPGRYQVAASLPGFKTSVAENVQVLVAQTVTVDLTLEIGEVAQQITVSAETPLLEKSTPEIGINTTAKEVHTWPILTGDGTRQLQSFIFRALPGTQGSTFAGAINGGQSYSHEILIEGISIGRMDLNGGSNNEFTATMDAVGEFKLQTGALSSQYGATQTALVNFGMKSGTNDYHGTAFWFHRNKVLNANSWDNNRFGREKSPFLDNNYGATFGGPIIKDRTHFFVSYEGERFTDQTVSGTEDLPVRPFKEGDFSALLDPAFTGAGRSGSVVGTDALGRPVIFGQLYDPASSRQLADGTWVRDPFPNNVIPANRFSRVTQAVLEHDIRDPQLFQLRRNEPRTGTCCPRLEIDNFSLKLDHVINERHNISGTYISNARGRDRFGGSTPRLTPDQFPGPAALGTKRQDTPGWIIRLSEDWTISPTLLNHVAVGYNRFVNDNASYVISTRSGIDWREELGMSQNVGGNTFPEIRFDGFNSTLDGSYANYGDDATSFAPNGSWIVADDLSWIRGNHNLRFGGEFRAYYDNGRSIITPGAYTFHNENTGLPGFVNQTGFAYASFMLGEAFRTSLGLPQLTRGIRSRLAAFYVQDNWKMTPNFTLSLGLRWDIPTPLYEGTGRMSSLDPDLPNPGADGFPGALAFRDSFAEIYYGQLAPRVGFAWAPRNDFVLRAGYGINYSPPIRDGFAWPYTAGFDGSNPIISRSGRFREDPVYNWDTEYPAFEGTLPNTDPAQRNGDSIGYYLPETNKFPYVQNWNVGVQFDVGWDTKIEANYIGNKGSRLNESIYLGALNQVQPKHLALGDTLIEDIDVHPEIARPYPSFDGTVARALRPFPQFETLSTHRHNGGWSNYNSLQVTATKRSSYGLSFLSSYTFSKTLATGDTAGPGASTNYGQDFYNRKADYGVTSFHVPHDLKITWIWNLPFGPQARWLNDGVIGNILGGWTVSAIQRYRSGPPLRVTAGGFAGDALFNRGIRPDVLLADPDQQVVGSPDTVDVDNGTPYLNPEAFAAVPKTANNVPLRLGNGPRWLPGVRGFAIFTEDLSLIKRTDLGFREGASVEFRFDVINVFNRVRLGGPVGDVNNSDFGRIFGKGGGPRNVQAGLRINF